MLIWSFAVQPPNINAVKFSLQWTKQKLWKVKAAQNVFVEANLKCFPRTICFRRVSMAGNSLYQGWKVHWIGRAHRPLAFFDFSLESPETYVNESSSIIHLLCNPKNSQIHSAPLVVRLGEWDISTTSEPLPYLEFDVAQQFIHPKFDVTNMKNGIAVLRLSQTVPIGRLPTIAPACLPGELIFLRLVDHLIEPNFPFSDKVLTGIRCFVSGWGSGDFLNDTIQAISRKVDLKILDSAACQATLRMTKLGKNFVLDSSFICAGGEKGKDACKGDGGVSKF